MIALRKMATREAFAGTEAQAHIQALMVIVSTYERPQHLAHEEQVPQFTPSSRSASSPPASSSASSSSSSEVATPAPPQDMAAPTTAQTPFRAKRRERPLQSPQATPSPQAKGVRLTEPHAQASQEQPATTSNIQQPATKQRKESESKEENIGKGVKRSEWKRVHKLSQEIRAIGGKLINEDKENRHKQTRLSSPEHCGEVLQFSFNAGVHDGCGLFLVKWYKDKETKCQVCE